MTTNHTPGPWEHGMTDQWGQQIDIWESKTTRTLARTVLNLPIEEQWANARLIAASPELLQALEAAEQWLKVECAIAIDGLRLTHGPSDALAIAQAAIAKARGE